MDLREIQNLIKFVAKAGVNEVKLETEDFKISIKTTPDLSGAPIVTTAPQYVPMPPTTPAVSTNHISATKEENSKEENSNFITINSPMIGTFYRKPAPDKPVFINVGDMVTVGTPVCIIEAMKLFNEIESEISGKIVKVLVDDSSPVEFGQPLFLVDPS